MFVLDDLVAQVKLSYKTVKDYSLRLQRWTAFGLRL
jgi:hypothetical protein